MDSTSSNAPVTKQPGAGPPKTSPRKSVSLPPIANNDPVNHTPAYRKILSRKPTPFNSDFSETIRRSGINALIPNCDSTQPNHEADSAIDPESSSKAAPDNECNDNRSELDTTPSSEKDPADADVEEDADREEAPTQSNDVSA